MNRKWDGVQCPQCDGDLIILEPHGYRGQLVQDWQVICNCCGMRGSQSLWNYVLRAIEDSTNATQTDGIRGTSSKNQARP